MCGIAGVRRLDGRPVDPGVLAEMTSRLTHRGPDDEGAWLDGAVGFGHRRLSIIDLGGSRQPMASTDGRYHLVFNGEIFNYRELRAGLAPYPFTTSGDTETLLASFARSGVRSVHDLRGQFAFAVHDAADGSLTLVRDRLGVLPLYYYLDASRFVFASEAKALLPALASVSVDEESIESYLGHRAVPAPRTLFRGVRKLPPGHWLRLDAAGEVEVQRYWSPPPPAGPCDPHHAVRRVAAALESAVEASLVADVPVGALLSGGLDSSLLVALASRLRGGGASVDTFSAGFGDPRFDELPYARRVSRLLGTRHHEIVVAPDDFVSLWPKLTWHRDAPISEPADVAVFRLAELARHDVKVLLSGEGSDELFAGYPKYRAEPVVAACHRVPAAARRAVASATERLLPARLDKARIALRALAASDDDERRRSWFAPFDEHGRAALLRGGARGIDTPDDGADGRSDVVDRMLRSDVRVWLADNLLERGDRMAMAAGVELRPPFLDHRLVELAFSLPSDVKVRRGVGKWAVKEVARRYLPADVVDRRKVGFRVPLDVWFRTSLRADAEDRLLDRDSLARRMFDEAEVRRLLRSHAAGRNEDIRIWTLVCLEVWHDVFFRTAARAVG